MSRKSRNTSDNPKLAIGKEMPLLDLLRICDKNGLRLWVQTSCPPVHLPVDMAFLVKREEEMFASRKYHAIWVAITTNHSLNQGIIHCKYVEYKHAEKPPYADGHRAEEKERMNLIRTILKIAKTHNHAKDQNLHSKSISKIRRNRTIR